ncbi:MAG TPA: NAD(P)-dependent oxidoreductase [Chloroflexota bacterium]|nr:NAD(P)-dependent oxidoreductase [Chloroflexota bacterium]
MSVLITGGGGFLGIRLARRLDDEGQSVSLFDRRFDSALLAEAGSIQEVVEGDVTDSSTMLNVIDRLRPEGVIHLAAILSGQCEEDPISAFAINVGGTFNVLEAARRAGVRRVVATSSAAAYDAPEPTGQAALDEDWPLSPMGFYAMTKAQVEAWSKFYHRRFGLDARVARPGAVVGPGRMASGAASNFTNAIIEEPLRGRPYVCPVAEDDAAPLVHRTDIVDGLARLYLAPEVGSRVYNMSPCHTSAGELARLVREREPKAQISFEPEPTAQFVVGRWRHAVMDSSRAARDLGWTPKFPTPASIVDACLAEIRQSNSAAN